MVVGVIIEVLLLFDIGLYDFERKSIEVFVKKKKK